MQRFFSTIRVAHLVSWALLLAQTAFLSFAAPAAHAQDWDVQSGDKRRQEIIRRYQGLLEKTPVEGFIFDKIIDYVGRGKGLDALIRDYEKKLEDRPNALNYRLILGHLLKTKNDYQGALDQYDKAVELGPNDPNTWLSRGTAHMLLQHQKEATDDFEKALNLERNKDKKQAILRKLADVSFAQHDWERAEKYYDQLIKLAPRDEYLRLEYAQVLVKYKRFEKALEQYDALIKMAGRDTKKRATTLRDKGDVLERMGKAEEAVEVYRQAMGLMRQSNWLYGELQLRVIDAYRGMDRLKELTEEFAKKWRSPNFDQSMTLADLYDELGDEEKALKFYRRASSKKRREVPPRLKIIAILKRRGEDKKVIAAYKELISVAGSQHRFQFDLVQLYFRIGERKKAEQQLARIARRFSRDAPVYLELADTYMRFDMRQKAQKAYERLVRMEPRNASYIMSLGEFYYRQGELEKAKKTWDRLLKTHLEKPEAYALLGNTYAEHGMIDQGIIYYQKAVELAPQDLEIRRGLALNFVRARRWQQGIDAWRHVMRHAESAEMRAQARGRIITIQDQRGLLAQKIDDWQAAFSGDTPDVQAGYFLAEAHIHRKEYAEAEAVYLRLVDLDSVRDENDLEALASLLRIYQQNGQPKKAIAILEELAKLRPKLARDYYHQIADLALKLYQDDKAVDYARRAVEQNPDDAMAHAQLASVYQQMQRFQAAVDAYQKAVDLDPRALTHAMKLAELYMELHEFDKAEALYRRVVQKADDEALILNAGRAAMKLAEADGRLAQLEMEFSPLVFQTRAKPVYRKLMLEIYEQLITPLVQDLRYGVLNAHRAEQNRKLSAQLDQLSRASLPVLLDALHAEDIGQRALAIRLLGDVGAGAAAAPLARIAVDANDSLRSLAAIAVIQIGDARASRTLIDALNHEDPAIRDIATWALGFSGGAPASGALADVLRRGQNVTQQALAAVSLGRIGDKTAVAALGRAAQAEAAERGRDQRKLALVWALGKARVARAVPLLRQTLQSGTDEVGGVAAWSLAQIGDDAAFAALLDAYWSGKPLLREHAARGLAQFSAKSTAAKITAATPPAARPNEALNDVQFINVIRHELSTDALITDLRQRAQFADLSTSKSLLSAHSAAIEKTAASKLSAEDLQVRRVVLNDLADMTRQEVHGVLTPVSPADDAAVTTLLSQLHPRVQQLAAGASPPLLRPIARLLAAIGDPDDQARLLEYAAAQATGLRAAAVAALGEASLRYSGNARGSEAAATGSRLESSLQDPAFAVRAAAAISLGQWARVNAKQEAKATELLLPLLHDDSTMVRQAAAQGLVQVGSTDAISQLGSRLDALPTVVQLAALQALKQTSSPAALKVLNSYQSHPDVRLRQAAQR